MRLRFVVVLSALLCTLSAQAEEKPTKILIHSEKGTTTLQLPEGWDPCPGCRNLDIWSFYAGRTLKMKLDPLPLHNLAGRLVQQEFSWIDLHSLSSSDVVVELTVHSKAGKALAEVLSKNVVGMNADFHQGAMVETAEASSKKAEVVTAVATKESPWSTVKLDCKPAHCFGKQQVMSEAPDGSAHEVIGIFMIDPGPKSDIYLSFVVYSSKDSQQLPQDLVTSLARSVRTESN